MSTFLLSQLAFMLDYSQIKFITIVLQSGGRKGIIIATSTFRGSPISRMNRQRRARGKSYVADAAAALQISTERRGQPVTSTLRGSPIRKLNRKRGAGGGQMRVLRLLHYSY